MSVMWENQILLWTDVCVASANSQQKEAAFKELKALKMKSQMDERLQMPPVNCMRNTAAVDVWWNTRSYDNLITTAVEIPTLSHSCERQSLTFSSIWGIRQVRSKSDPLNVGLSNISRPKDFLSHWNIRCVCCGGRGAECRRALMQKRAEVHWVVV